MQMMPEMLDVESLSLDELVEEAKSLAMLKVELLDARAMAGDAEIIAALQDPDLPPEEELAVLEEVTSEQEEVIAAEAELVATEELAVVVECAPLSLFRPVRCRARSSAESCFLLSVLSRDCQTASFEG